MAECKEKASIPNERSDDERNGVRSSRTPSTSGSTISTRVMDGTIDQMLTPREKQVLLLLCEGYTHKEIGARLDISPKTVQRHRGNISAKTGHDSAAQLVRLAIRLGWIDA